MKIFSVRGWIFLSLAGFAMAVAACSSGSSSGVGGTTSALGLPKIEMKCNGQSCIQ